jgi:hypothetical protein
MGFSLIINSSNLTNTNTNGTYTYNFIGGGFTVPDNMEVMLSSAQIPYSIYNITSVYNNNSFKIFRPSGATQFNYLPLPDVVIPDGFYTIKDLNSFMQQYAIINGFYLIDANGQNVYYTPEFSINSVSYAVQLTLYTVPRSLPIGWIQPLNWVGYSTYTLDRTPFIQILATNNFGDFIGFIPNSYPPTLPNNNNNISILSNKTPIGSYVNSIIVHCSLVNNPVVSPSDILDAFQIANVSFGSNINYSPKVEKYVKLTKGKYSSMVLYLTDQDNNPLYLIDPNILITLFFRTKK